MVFVSVFIITRETKTIFLSKIHSFETYLLFSETDLKMTNRHIYLPPHHMWWKKCQISSSILLYSIFLLWIPVLKAKKDFSITVCDAIASCFSIPWGIGQRIPQVILFIWWIEESLSSSRYDSSMLRNVRKSHCKVDQKEHFLKTHSKVYQKTIVLEIHCKKYKKNIDFKFHCKKYRNKNFCRPIAMYIRKTLFLYVGEGQYFLPHHLTRTLSL